MTGPAGKRIDLTMEELEAIIERAEQGRLSPEDSAKLRATFETFVLLVGQLEGNRTSLDKLRRILFGPKTEKLGEVLGGGRRGGKSRPPASDANADPDGEKKRKGHGRNAAQEYTGAAKVTVLHDTLKHGGPCPRCQSGKVYTQRKPKTLVRIVGVAPLQAKIYELQRLRCNLCGDIFTAPSPPEVGEEKYDHSAAAFLGLIKYGSGMPRYRLEGLQQNLGTPLPQSTQWDVVFERVPGLRPIFDEHIRQAAQGKVLHNDDTPAIILDLLRRSRPIVGEGEEIEDDERTGVFTTGIISEIEGHRIALFFTGRQHAGENLADVLKQRAAGLAPPIQMCDALSRNLPKPLETILGNCLAHGRRHFVDVATRFPEECRHLLEEVAVAYKVDEQARKQKLSPDERLILHQRDSAPRMAELKLWLQQQLDERKVEPNSGLGKAMRYMLNHWEKLTLFLRVAGAPIDNTICERALKRVVLHRKNSLFYKTKNGAEVGDIFMTLIHTAELAKVNVFDYLCQLMRHPDEVAENPGQWMPWNYLDAVLAAAPRVGNAGSTNAAATS